ncbi:restriction endonuclease subunit S [Methanobrevibacter sp. TLL-48-HuF1]|uniref:restriction endonuclease subunit S n=1 Tax=Methanobrevibacter sp. TLL-48-HuF1 TaxID=2870563 RepID=UPI00202753F1|nr:restriction endonuclease subunit S [Methanobrevibacter sp. TLL-48-HuF1]
MSEEKLVPKLRFSGFTDEWKKSNLGNISSNEMYGMNSAAKDYDGFNKYIRITDISETSNKFIPNPLTSPDGDLEDKYKLKKGDIVFARTGASTGKTYLYDDNDRNLYFAGFLIKFHIDNANPKFIFYNTLKEEYLNWVSIMSVRSGQPGINSNEYKKLPIILPSLDEQNKISNFLTSIDKKIDLLERKHQFYQEFKKYLMQQIFTQKLRFADSDSCWKEISLKDIGTFYRGHSYNSTNVADEGLLVLRSNNIQGNVLDFSEDGLQFVDKDCKKELELQKNDIVICMSNGTRRLVGKSAEYTGNYENKVTVGAFCSIFRTENKLAKYLFQTESYKKNLYLILAGTNINNLKNSDLEKFKFNIPTNESEINKIHDLFVSIDNKIDYNKKQLEEITLFKKGLLQQMFV